MGSDKLPIFSMEESKIVFLLIGGICHRLSTYRPIIICLFIYRYFPKVTNQTLVSIELEFSICDKSLGLNSKLVKFNGL